MVLEMEKAPPAVISVRKMSPCGRKLDTIYEDSGSSDPSSSSSPGQIGEGSIPTSAFSGWWETTKPTALGVAADNSSAA